MPIRSSVLVADDECVFREELVAYFAGIGWEVEPARDGSEALARIRERDFDVVVTDLRMPGADGIAVLEEVHRRAPETGVILLTAYSTVRTAVEAFRQGAADYVVKPVVLADVRHRAERLVEHRRATAENRYLRKFLDARFEFEGIVGRSAPMRKVLDLVRRVAPLDSTVLILGESGTGKERVARAIHEGSSRKGGPFLAINCGAVPEALFESTLFGHVRGAFTGAEGEQEGLFRAARGGTLFLDEIATVPIELQSKLLRVLEERHVLPVGATRPVTTDVRLVAATNEDIDAAVEAGRFRSDLFYRLNVFPIRLPPLRERVEDIPDLIDHFVRRFNVDLGLDVHGIERDALADLAAYRWKGNVRELQNVIQRAMILCEGSILTRREFPALSISMGPDDDLPLAEAIRRFERAYIERTLGRLGGNRQETARNLHISPTTLWRRIRDLGIDRGEDGPEFQS